ncbi:hypothetical protein K488DRAFT_82591 [Vararia minispora EC-137]|uniref:Uncharacterized protein n=1 Tax=Vararia minispora EC-137 TaxID=1314806 RepID=A0ACB8QW02_9AGAM|nr:hypothetical protein K488DRAFT_82591 [Vararia minispora EC-137]
MTAPPPYYQQPPLPSAHQYYGHHHPPPQAAPSTLPPPIPYDRPHTPHYTPPAQPLHLPPPAQPRYSAPPGPPPRSYPKEPSLSYAPPTSTALPPPPRPQSATPQTPGSSTSEEDELLKRAIEASRRTQSEEQARAQEEKDIALAIELSQEEAARRMRELDEANMHMIFGDFGEERDGGLFDGIAGRETGLGGFVFPEPNIASLQPRPTPFDPHALQAQQAESLRQQEEYLLHQQQLAAQLQAHHEFLRQQEQDMSAQQQAQLHAQLIAQQQLLEEQKHKLEEAQRKLEEQQTQCAMRNEHASSRTGGPQFGSNNPFVSPPPSGSLHLPAQVPSPVSASLSPPSYADITTSLPSGLHSRSSTLSSGRPTTVSSSPQTAGRPTRADGEHSHLASLYAGKNIGDGVDTFGNIGQLRFGATDAGKITVSQNP